MSSGAISGALLSTALATAPVPGRLRTLLLGSLLAELQRRAPAFFAGVRAQPRGHLTSRAS
eukprot:1697502-Alexandrium_andersonii.AAC.1